MFGATTLIQAHYEKGKGSGWKSTTHFCVIRLDEIRRRPGLQDMDRYGIGLLALLSGGDYDTVEIPKCGPHKALATFKEGFARPIRHSMIMDRDLGSMESAGQGISCHKRPICTARIA
jgi:hypothetical protein